VNNQDVQESFRKSPRFYYGYIVVIAAFIIMVVSWATYNSFGIFLTPLLDEFDWNSAATSGAFSLSMFIYGVLGIVVGGLNDRFGPRAVLTFCVALLGLGYLLMSQVGTLWHLYVFFGVIVGVGMSGVWVPQLSTVARWFDKRRTLMTGIVIAGVGIGQFVGPPITSRLIVAYDWPLASIILGVAVLLTGITAAQFLRREPAQAGRTPYEERERRYETPTVAPAFSFREAAATAQFWIAFGILFSYGFGLFAFIVHIVPHAIGLNISPVSAANILALRGAIGIFGSYTLGAVADRIGNKQIYIIGFIVMSAALFWLSFAGEEWMLYLFVVVFGFVIGGMATSESPLTAWLFGLGSHGLIYGVVHVGFTVGAAAGPFVAGYIFDVTGSYQMAFLISAAVGVVGLVLTVILRPVKKLSVKT
jgi:MFS family permease